ncbi:MAG TPA: hypothetical protein VF576_06775 [Rubricoccaceae bacterium]|jgi:hypothetical protein
MPTPLTPEHLQLLPKRRLEAAVRPAETASEPQEGAEMSRLAKYELRRRQAQVPVPNRYASGAVRSVTR